MYLHGRGIFLNFTPRNGFVRFRSAVTSIKITRCVNENSKICTVSLLKMNNCFKDNVVEYYINFDYHKIGVAYMVFYKTAA